MILLIVVVFILNEEGNVLFDDTLNTFYSWLYGVGHHFEDTVNLLLCCPLYDLYNHVFLVLKQLLMV